MSNMLLMKTGNMHARGHEGEDTQIDGLTNSIHKDAKHVNMYRWMDTHKDDLLKIMVHPYTPTTS
jgi:hypothetical protein